jgi:choline kinase
MNAIILAAGKGSRLGALIEEKPKCLLQFGQETLLERQIRILKENGISENDIYVVGGYRHEKLQGLCKNIIINDKYDITDNSYSLGIALKQVNHDDVLILDGDLVYEGEIISDVIKDNYVNIIVSKKSDDLSESTGIEADLEGYVTGIGKNLKGSGYVYLSILKVGKNTIGDFSFELLADNSQKTWYTAPLTKILGKHKFINKVTLHKWHEIDYVDDYVEAKKYFGIED